MYAHEKIRRAIVHEVFENVAPGLVELDVNDFKILSVFVRRRVVQLKRFIFMTTLQELQWILTHATLLKVSDMISQWWSMRKYFERNEEICIKTNTE